MQEQTRKRKEKDMTKNTKIEDFRPMAQKGWRVQSELIENGLSPHPENGVVELAGWILRNGDAIPAYWDAISNPGWPHLREARSDDEWFHWILSPGEAPLKLDEMESPFNEHVRYLDERDVVA
jgi:hypothetical protein